MSTVRSAVSIAKENGTDHSTVLSLGMDGASSASLGTNRREMLLLSTWQPHESNRWRKLDGT
jgi:hypothetical protein